MFEISEKNNDRQNKNEKHNFPNFAIIKICSIEDILPNEIVQHSMSFLQPKQRFAICNVSKKFEKLTKESINLDIDFQMRVYNRITGAFRNYQQIENNCLMFYGRHSPNEIAEMILENANKYIHYRLYDCALRLYSEIEIY